MKRIEIKTKTEIVKNDIDAPLSNIKPMLKLIMKNPDVLKINVYEPTHEYRDNKWTLIHTMEK